MGALIDAGATLDAVQSAAPPWHPARYERAQCTGGLRALKVDVESRGNEHPHRSWARIRATLETAELPSTVRTSAPRGANDGLRVR